MDNVELQANLAELLHQARAEQQAQIDALSPEQRAATGTLARWSAKDVVAHVTYWWRVQADRLDAIAAGQVPESGDESQTDPRNAEAFAAASATPWPQIEAEARAMHDAFAAALQRLRPEQLGERVWRSILGNGYLHPQMHLSEFWREQGDNTRAVQIQERTADTMERLLPLPEVRALALYNLACVYALNGRGDQAVAKLAEAFPLGPELRAFARQDHDLDSLRERPDFQALTDAPMPEQPTGGS